MMKCENCPFHAVEGIQNDLSWCKLYSAKAPIEGCEGERDAFMKQQQLMQGIFEKDHD